MRVEMRAETVNDYANDMLDGAIFPPVIVFHDGCRLLACRWIPPRRGGAEDRSRDDRRRDQGRLLARRDPAWHRLQCDARSAPHPGGQAACGRATAERSRMGALVRSQDRRGRQGRSQDGRHDPPGTGWGIPHAATTTKAKRGEFPTANGKPTNRASLLGDVLRHHPRRCPDRGMPPSRPHGGGRRCLTTNRSRRWRRASGGRSRTCSRCRRPTIRSMPASARAGQAAEWFADHLGRARRGRLSSAPPPLPPGLVHRAHPQAGRPRVREHGKRLAISRHRQPGGTLSRSRSRSMAWSIGATTSR